MTTPTDDWDRHWLDAMHAVTAAATRLAATKRAPDYLKRAVADLTTPRQEANDAQPPDPSPRRRM